MSAVQSNAEVASGAATVATAGPWSECGVKVSGHCVLGKGTLAAVASLGMASMTPVQAQTIPLLLSNKDVVVQAATGSGKTLSYLLPLFELLQKKRDVPFSDSDVGAVVIVPNRELVLEVTEVAKSLAPYVPRGEKATGEVVAPEKRLRIVELLRGGSSIEKDLDKIKKQGCNIVISKPECLLEVLIDGKTLVNVKTLEMLVVDEADRLLGIFRPQLSQIIDLLPKQRRTGLFSAIRTTKVDDFSHAVTCNPTFVTIESKAPAEISAESSARVFVDRWDEKLVRDKHDEFVRRMEEKTDDLEYWVTEHLRVSGAYWGLTAVRLMRKLTDEETKGMVDWVLKCYDPKTGGFAGNEGHDPHLLYTLSAVQVLVLLGALDRCDVEGVTRFVVGLQQPDGSVAGDRWGEIDTRFSYIAVCCLSLLGTLDRLNIPKLVEYIDRCKNFDGGYGCVPDAESHAGQIFCCVAALDIVGATDHIDRDKLSWWLSERQVLPCGGMNGRPEKLPDVCYSWWVLSALAVLGRLNWIDQDKLADYIISCQDTELGGIADRPGDAADVYHLFFGLAGLSLMHKCGLEPIDPSYALPVSILRANSHAVVKDHPQE